MDSGSSKFGDSSVIELAGRIMVVTIILLFFFLVFIFCLHMYAKWFRYRRQENNNSSDTGRRRLNFTAGHHETAATTALRRGLDAAVLSAIPIILFDPKELEDGLECAVCLSEVCEGEKTRVLPMCNHGFHVECIDMWFQSHSTCPLCRNPVSNMDYAVDSSTLETSVIQLPVEEGISVGDGLPAPHSPTDVLFPGDGTRASPGSTPWQCCAEADNVAINVEPSSSYSSNSVASTSNNNVARDGELVIDVPIRLWVNELQEEEEEVKSPRVLPRRLRSLKRLLSGNARNSKHLDHMEHGTGDVCK